jgi:hypothetical protein
MVVTVMETATFGSTINIADSSDALWTALVQARQALNDANVPRDGRILLVGSDVETEMLLDPKFNRVDSAGEGLAVGALREATITRLAGFTIIGSNALDPETAIAYHPTAFAFVNVAPVVPEGVTYGSRQAESGLAMRWIRDYDALYLRDRSVVSSFAGCTSVEDNGSTNVRAVKINFNGAS